MSPSIPRLRTLLAASAAMAILSGLAHPAQAETASGESAGSGELEAVVVTAEKREQSLQDVPLAVSAYTSAERDRAGITSIQDIVNFTPGMDYSGTDRVSLRGAGRNTFFIGNDPGVASYADGFYSASSSELFKSPLFVERAEILRGPQGTLYGRNAIGGAVNIISRRPAQSFSGEVRGIAANGGRYRAEGVVSLPLAEHLRLKIGGSHEEGRGFIRNIGGGGASGSIRRNLFEAQLEAELGARTSVWLRYARTGWDDTTGVGDHWANLVSPYDTALPFGPIAQLVTNPQYGYGVANPGVADPYVQNTNRRAYGQLRGNHLLTLQAAHDLGFAELKYIGGFQQYNYQTGGDYDQTNRTSPITVAGVSGVFVDYTTDFDEHKKYFSNEINLTSKGEGPLQWILGLYEYHETYRQRIQLGDPQQVQLARPCYLVGPPAFCAPAPANPERDYVDQNAALTSDAWAVFGQGVYRLSDAWALTAGLRYTQDRKRGLESQRLILYSPAGPFGPALGGQFAFDVSTDLDPAAPGVQNVRRLSGDWESVTGAVNLSWTPDADTLAYGRYSRGYKSGGFLLGSLSPQPQARPEAVDAFELGLKKTFAGTLSVNASAFYNGYQDLQLAVQQLNKAQTTTANYFVNVDARALGLELEAAWNPIRALQITASYGWLDTRITRGCCFYDPADPSARLPGARPAGAATMLNGVPIVYQSLKGSRLYQSPRNKAAVNGAYTVPFGRGALTLSATYTWTDTTTYQPFDDPAFRTPAYGTADFRAIWTDAQDRYTVIGFVKNAFDETGYTSTGPSAPFATFGPGAAGLQQTGVTIYRGLIQPRTYGMELQHRF